MTLQPGCRFVVAPHFHLAVGWPERLMIGTGVAAADGGVFPLPSWRPPTADELTLLTRDPAPDPAELEDCLCVFQLPKHVQAEWWRWLEENAEALGSDELPGFDAFVTRISDFLAFKQLPFPEGAHCDLIVTSPTPPPLAPAQDGPNQDANRPTGLRCNLAPWTPWPIPEEKGWPRMWGGINLGDEATSLALINLSYEQLLDEQRRRFPDQLAPESVGDLVGRFLHGCPDYPPVRLILGPGEGFRLPRCGLVLDGYLAEKRDPDLFLLITQD